MLIAFSYHGGTGSGMAPLFWSSLDIDFPKSQTIKVAVAPSLNNKGSEVISAYNILLALHETLDSSKGITLSVDNDRIADLLK